MKVSGFTIVRNACNGDYPVVASLHSLLPLVDELIVLLGNSNDGTKAYLLSSVSSPKLKIIDSIWDDNLREGGRVLAVETDKAKALCSKDADWLFYLQADECIHEKDYPVIKEAMAYYLDKKSVKGLVFQYFHFYASYDYLASSRKWYRNEIRIIRNDKEISSYKDAQGFRINGKKTPAALLPASIYHYGWVKHPEKQMAKQVQARKFWHDDTFIQEKVAVASAFDYSEIDTLRLFNGTHPQAMQERILQKNWNFTFDVSIDKRSLKEKIIERIEKLTGWRPGEFRNYRIIDKYRKQ